MRTGCATLMHGARSLLDLGTGGGERLLELRDDWPPRVAATEGYPPNLALAAAAAGPVWGGGEGGGFERAADSAV